MAIPMSGGNEYTGVSSFSYLAEWRWRTVWSSGDPNAKPFGPPPWSMRQGLIRAVAGPDLSVTIGQLPGKTVRYLPVKRRGGVDTFPGLIVHIQLVPPQNNQNMQVPAWQGTSVDVDVFNRINNDPFAPGGGAPDPTLKLTGALVGPDLTCRIEIPPATVKTWLTPTGTLKGAVNDNLLDFKFKLNGVMDDGQPVVGQSRNRLFLYCRKTIVFLPGLFGSQVQFKTADGETLGFPDFWSERLRNVLTTPGMPSGAGLLASVPDMRFQRADVLECDDKGVPLIPSPKPTLLRMWGMVVSPFDAVHNARVKLHPRIPENFRLYTLVSYPYDWREDLTDAAAALLKHLADLRDSPRGLAAATDYEDQVAVIGHSTGGVVIRRALASVDASECTPGLDPAIKNAARPASDSLINFAFFLSVPFSGAPKANAVLLTGLDAPEGNRQIPFIVPESLVAVSLSMPIVYHLNTSPAYAHRPCTSPSRPPGAGLDIEADKAAFVTDALAAGLMPRPWVVKADLATAADHRQRLALAAQKWHELISELYDRVGGRVLMHAISNSWGAVNWFQTEVTNRGLQWQKDVRAPLGWNAYLAGRARDFHAKSRTAVTGPWKTRAAVIWGSCKQSVTLRQLNLSKVSVQTYSDTMAFLQTKRILMADIGGIRSRPVITRTEGNGFKGGARTSPSGR